MSVPAPVDPAPEIRTATRADLETVLGWAEAEGWNPGVEDAARFHAADPEGFVVALHEGRPAASVSVVRLGADRGFLGLYLCRPELRGRGLGLAVWRAGMARMAGRVVGLDGVVAQQANYARSGFAPSHRNLRFAGVPCLGGAATAPAEPRHAAAILALDRRATGLDRPGFMAAWSRPGPDRHVRVLERDGELEGFGVLRRCAVGWKVGPLVARDPGTAADLLCGLASDAAGEPMMLDVPEPNAAGLALAEAAGLAPVFETARMWTGPAPAEDPAQVFGVATLELG